MMVSPAASYKSDDNSLELRENTSNSLNPSICEDSDTLLVGTKLIAVIVGLSCCVFCTSLDNTIVATAIPKIAADFQSVEDVGWYASSYLLTTCAVTLSFGRMYTYFTVKWVYLGALLVFELGSLICATAPSSVAFIIGRAIAGLGGGGLFSGSLVVISQCVPVRRRPAFSGLIMGMFAVASVIAPL
jgi:MFS family permease